MRDWVFHSFGFAAALCVATGQLADGGPMMGSPGKNEQQVQQDGEEDFMSAPLEPLGWSNADAMNDFPPFEEATDVPSVEADHHYYGHYRHPTPYHPRPHYGYPYWRRHPVPRHH